MKNFSLLYNQAISDPHSFTFVLIGYFIGIGTICCAVLKTLLEIHGNSRKIDQLTAPEIKQSKNI